jgi:hypothetical protein
MVVVPPVGVAPPVRVDPPVDWLPPVATDVPLVAAAPPPWPWFPVAEPPEPPNPLTPPVPGMVLPGPVLDEDPLQPDAKVAADRIAKPSLRSWLLNIFAILGWLGRPHPVAALMPGSGVTGAGPHNGDASAFKVTRCAKGKLRILCESIQAAFSPAPAQRNRSSVERFEEIDWFDSIASPEVFSRRKFEQRPKNSMALGVATKAGFDGGACQVGHSPVVEPQELENAKRISISS